MAAGLSAVMAAGGCTGIEPALVGAAVAGVSTGVGATRLGKLNVAFHADVQRTLHAVSTAADELGLSIREQQQRANNRWVVSLEDLRRNTITVTVEERGARLTHVQVNVGWFGASAVAQLLAKRVGVHTLGEAALELPPPF